MMGGQIGVNSEPGRGSEFHFTLEFGFVPQPKAVPDADWSGCRVLVVDDSANAREVLQGLLAEQGCLHDAVNSAAAAHEALAARHYDVVLLDWKMPGEDGFEAARRIRALSATRARPGARPALVMVTAYGDTSTTRRALAEGFTACLSKPVTPSALAQALGDALGHRRQSPALPQADGLEPIEQLGGCRILLVEDNELNQIVAADLLGGVAGALVQIANNGHEALTLLDQHPFDLVLMDVQMPGMDGYEATRRLRANPAWAALPVVAMTAHAMERDRVLCLAAGMNDFVSKPFEPRVLFKVLARWLAREGSARPAAAAPAGDAAAGPAPVSFELGLHRCMGRRDLYGRVLRSFAECHGDDAQRLQETLQRGETATADRMAHTLVATAGAIGAEGLATAARALQQALSEGEQPGLDGLLAAFTTAHAAVMAALRAHAQAQPGAPAATP
jgi:CheY-like chemotaxis protein/HPt (histidine-containing phosphotransfer) domain-containing protein